MSLMRNEIWMFKAGVCSHLLLAVLAFLLPALASMALGCPSRCECLAQHRAVVCHRRRLRAIPDGIPIETQVLDLRKNQLSDLHPHTFATFSQLEELQLSENILGIIEPGSFHNLPALRILNLRNNRLKLLPVGVFTGLGNLTHLDISDNRLVILLDFTFKDLGNLRHLELGDNDLVYISNLAFVGLHSLEDLKLERCNLTVFPSEALNQLQKLTMLGLNYLNISDLKPFGFRGLQQLRILEIDNWPLLKLLHPLSFDHLNLTSLAITNTNITAVPGTTLQHLGHLRRLNLSFNAIELIETGAFEKLIWLQELTIAGAALKTIEPLAFRGLAHLRVLNLTRNLLRSLEEQAFQTTETLEILRIDSNPLTCDCRLLWVINKRRWLDFGGKDPTCQAPIYLHGLTFAQIPDVLPRNYFTCRQPRMLGPRLVTLMAIEEQMALLPCRVEGDPFPNIAWISPWKQRIVGKQGSGKMIILKNGTLQLHFAQLADSGVYTCIAANAVGNATSFVRLNVKRFAPQPLYINETHGHASGDVNYNIH
uniref:Leucine rich repeat and Ig domain containing 2 n=1 Tax=Eptatretus burgeri TaxID=7764 RepID=A0A8C4NKV4_EPTBU